MSVPIAACTEYYEWRLDRITLPDGERGLVCYFRDISAHVAARTAVEESREALQGSRSPQGRVPRDARPRAAQAARADPQRARDTAAVRPRRRRRAQRLRDDGAAGQSHGAAGRRPPGSVAHHARQDRAAQGSASSSRPSSAAPSRRRGRSSTRPAICLTVDLGGEPLELDADPVRLAQVFGNLLNNAAKYTPNGGQITLRARAARRRTSSCRSATTAPAFAPTCSRTCSICSSRASARYSRSQGGLGIGLTLARSIVVLHGGTIEARSAGSGRAASSSCACRCCARRARPRRSSRAGRDAHRRASAFSSSTTTSTPPRAWARCCAAWVPSGHGARRRRPRSRRCEPQSRPRPCSTSACRGWTATRWRGACARPRAATTSR